MSMIVLNINSSQQFTIIPIKEMSYDTNNNLLPIYLKFTDEQTKISYQKIATFTQSNKDLFTIGFEDATFLYENAFFDLKIFFGTSQEVIYKDIIFCTTQSKENFTINDGEYITPSITNNDYIVIQ